MYRLVVSLVIMLLVAIFSVQNKDMVYVSFLIWNTQVPLVIVVLGSLTAGAVLSGFLGVFRQFSMGRKIKAGSKRAKNLEEENAGLKKRIEELQNELSTSQENEEETDKQTESSETENKK